jgi:LacI family transcriptional regulator
MARPTLRSIAQEAGMSVTAVSLALRGQGNLSEATVQRIRKIAKDQGYIPNPILASLASRRFRTADESRGMPMALLEFPSQGGSGPEAKTSTQYRNFLLNHAENLGYSPKVYTFREISSYRDLSRMLYHRGTQAVITTGQPDMQIFGRGGYWNSVALVQCGRYRGSLPFHMVRSNIFQAIRITFDQVRARGYRRIGFALGHHNEILEDDLARLGSALAMLDQFVPPADRVPPYFGAFGDPRKLLAWGIDNRVDAYISFSVGLWYTLHEAGISCPRDVGFVTLHRPSWHDPVPNEPDFSGLDQCADEIALQSVLLADQMVRYNERGIPATPREILIRPTWIEGATLHPGPDPAPREKEKGKAKR